MADENVTNKKDHPVFAEHPGQGKGRGLTGDKPGRQDDANVPQEPETPDAGNPDDGNVPDDGTAPDDGDTPDIQTDNPNANPNP